MKNSSEISSKIVSTEEIRQLIREEQNKGKRIGFTNGCFDILHYGHIDYLTKAAALCDVLIIGVNSDGSVKKLKGNHRPINDQQSRTYILAALSCISYVVVFEQDTPYELIQQIQPNLLIKGGDYSTEEIVGHDIVKSLGGEVITIDFVDGYSTSIIEQKIKRSEGPK